MDVKETITLLTWINQTDPRVMLNQASVERWHNALRTFEYAVAKQAVLEHYKHHEEIPASSAAIYKRAGYIKTAREAGQRAIEANPKQSPRHPLSWRARNPELWDQLFEEGRRQGNAERARATERRQGTQEETNDGWMAA